MYGRVRPCLHASLLCAAFPAVLIGLSLSTVVPASVYGMDVRSSNRLCVSASLLSVGYMV